MHLMTALDLSFQAAISIKYAAFSSIDFRYRYSTHDTLALWHTRVHTRRTLPYRLLGLLTGCLSTVKVI